jgi:hypothetical protein
VRASLLAALAILAGACSFAPLDAEGRRCPCRPGWECSDGICVPAGTTRDAGPRDAGSHDAPALDARPDGGSLDAGERDGGPDSGSRDGGLRDAGPPDTGSDAGPCHELAIDLAHPDDDGQFDHDTLLPMGDTSAMTLQCGSEYGMKASDAPQSCFFRFVLPEEIPDGASAIELRVAFGHAGSSRWFAEERHGLLLAVLGGADARRPTGATIPPALRTPGPPPTIRWPAIGAGGPPPGYLPWVRPAAPGDRIVSPDLVSLAGPLRTAGGGLASGTELIVWAWGAFDGDDATVWIQRQEESLPAQLIVRWCDPDSS